MAPKKCKHLDRKELLEMARMPERKRSLIAQHIAQCQDCRDLAELLCLFDMTGRQTLLDAPQDWITRAVQVACGLKRPSSMKRVIASLIFDSWAMPQPVGVRGTGIEKSRRMRFHSESITMDIHAEYQDKKWIFTAYIPVNNSRDGHLIIGSRTIPSDSGGFYHWTASKPPVTFYFESRDGIVEFSGLKWKKPKTN